MIGSRSTTNTITGTEATQEPTMMRRSTGPSNRLIRVFPRKYAAAPTTMISVHGTAVLDAMALKPSCPGTPSGSTVICGTGTGTVHSAMTISPSTPATNPRIGMLSCLACSPWRSQ